MAAFPVIAPRSIKNGFGFGRASRDIHFSKYGN
jgi:hypothetical protein